MTGVQTCALPIYEQSIHQPITVYSCHLGWYHDEEEPFKGQVDELIAHLSKDQLTIIMGDFNNDMNKR